MLKKCLAVIALIVSLTPASYAVLQLELTHGIDAALPIAVLPFHSQQQSMPVNIGQIVQQDLQNSGRFKAIDSSGADSHDAKSLDQARWRKLGANDAVVGNMQALADGRYQVDYTLVNLYAAPAKGANPKVAHLQGIMLQQSFTVTADRLRGLAHYIADAVYQKITGKRGVFSTKIAYVLVNQQGYELQVADYDGYNPQTVFRSRQPIMSPTWSPDGKKIAYVTFQRGRAAIYVNNLTDGSRQLISRQFGVNGAPAFSPDGTRIALALSRSGHMNIFIKTLNSGKLQQITNDWSINTEPVWTKNGQKLLFTSDRGGNPQIYQVNLITHKTSRVTYSGSYNARANILPDGSILTLHREGKGPYSLASQSLTDNQVQVITRASSKYTQSPSVSPNGELVIYSTRLDGGNGRFVLAMASVDNKIQLVLPAQAGNVREPTWSPFLS